MARRVLILLAHPALERSRINRRLIAAVRDLDGLTIRDLYELYPDLDIRVAREQAALLEHDVIVFQHPFYWYSVPAILKQWQDLVLAHGWAYGEKGHALDGKITFNALSSGGPEQSYRPEGFNRFSVRDLLAPWEATAHLCRMKYLAPFVVHGAHRIGDDGDLKGHVDDYRRVLMALRDEKVDLEAAARAQRLNADLEAVLA